MDRDGAAGRPRRIADPAVLRRPGRLGPHPSFSRVARARPFEILILARPTLAAVKLDDRQRAGLCLFSGTVQFAIFLTVAEAAHPGYSVSLNFVSDLGVGPAANIFNGSIIVLGVAILATAWFLLRAFRDRILTITVALAGAGAVGVGVFTEAFGLLHTIVSFVTFVFAALSAILAFQVLRPPLSYLSVALGASSFVALALFATRNYLELGHGGMERMIVWPVLAWGIGFGGHLLGAAPVEKPAAA